MCDCPLGCQDHQTLSLGHDSCDQPEIVELGLVIIVVNPLGFSYKERSEVKDEGGGGWEGDHRDRDRGPEHRCFARSTL